MLYLEFVRKTYQEAIALNSKIPSDLKIALKSHERMPLLFQNLAIELQKVQDLYRARGKPPVSEKTMKSLVYDVTDMFISGVESEAKSRYESDAQKALKELEAQKLKDIQETASGNVSGEYQEIFDEGGVIATSERDVL
jgi:hypothetical protein